MTGELKEKTYEYESDYGKYLLKPWINTYANNDNLALGFDFFDEECGGWEPYCYATVNLIPLPYLEGAIDTNDNDTKLLDFLEENGFGQRTGFGVQSGYCVFPTFRFNEDKIKEIDPKVFARYQKAAQPLLEDQIVSAEASKKAKDQERASVDLER